LYRRRRGGVDGVGEDGVRRGLRRAWGMEVDEEGMGPWKRGGKGLEQIVTAKARIV